MTLTPQQIEACREWCRSHYWQLQEKRGWRYKFHESVMVRYYEEANLDPTLLEPLLEYLKNEEWQTVCTVHNKPFDAEGWVTKDAWYQTGDGDTKDTTKLKVTRIYHAMTRPEADGEGDGPYEIENGCAYRVSFEFFWNQTKLPIVPDSESGVSYRLSGVTRNDDTGLFNCVLERRERVQQDIPEYVREVDAFKTQSREEHKGVKGETTKGGKPASVKQGVIVTRDVSKNEDCTHDTSNTTIESNEVNGAVTETTVGLHGGSTVTVNRNMRNKANEEGLQPGESVRNELNEDLTWNQTIRSWKRDFLQWLRGVCRKTIYRHTHAITTATGTDPGFDHVSIPTEDPGKVHEIDVQRTETGFDVTDTVNEDLPVSNATVEKRVFLDGITKTTVNRNQAAPARDFDVGIGGSVRNEKTESGLYDQTIVEASAEDVGKTGEHCEQTHLVHTHGQTDVLGSDNVPESIEATAEAGQTASIRMERTERGGYRVVKEIRKANEAHAESRGGTVSRTVSTDSFRNTDSIPSGEPSVNEEIDVSASVNEFGKYDGTTRKTKYSPETTTSVSSNPLFSETTTVVTNDTDVNPNETANDGEYVTVSSSPTGHGSANKTITRRTAKPADAKATTTSESRTVEMTSFRNRDGEVSESAGVNEEIDVSVSVNEFGRKDGTVRKTKYSPETTTSVSSNPLFSETTTVVTNDTDVNPNETANDGEYVTVSSSPTGHGSANKTITRRTAKPADAKATTTSESRTVEMTSFRNRDGEVSESAGVNEEIDVSVSVNEFGRKDGTVRKTKYSPETTTSVSSNPLFSETTTVVTNDTDVNPVQKSVQGVIVSTSASPTGRNSANVTKTVRTAHGRIMPGDFDQLEWDDVHLSATRKVVYHNRLVVFRNQKKAPRIEENPSGSCSPSVSINEFGLLDGTYHYKALVSDEPVGDGSGGGSMEYTADMSVTKGKHLYSGKVVVYTNTSGSLKTGFLNGAVDYPDLKLHASDNGRHGVKYYGFREIV